MSAGRLQEAARAAIAREERTESPHGEWRQRLWYPAPDERRACCARIEPTAANRQALESHCRTQAHVARLFDVPPAELRKAVKRARAGGGHPAGRDGRALYEVSRGAHGTALQELRGAAESCERLLPRLISAATADEGLPELLEEAVQTIDRLKLTLEYCRKVEATYDAARAAHEISAALFEAGKRNA